eukprot:CAMPEP_0202976654 /NCGR_PEP_ID=MMETSP1396-20130829/79459_1 /ASSEMBLY_ACC=CAM_ASM_000872 /TAXON_ID= /ORGANISM="Pseudokeronopsis sp., Strain Brazil" /LENGTH=118 /DNA_ID=CAMNT_0049714375 /DNA_START=333 /DNA_END=685 /DNA_ORIENTATION=+
MSTESPVSFYVEDSFFSSPTGSDATAGDKTAGVWFEAKLVGVKTEPAVLAAVGDNTDNGGIGDANDFLAFARVFTINGCFNASLAVIRSFGLLFNNEVIIDFASSDNRCHTLGFTFKS